MKKLVTILMVAVLAVSCICVFAACEKGEPLADTEGYSYMITGNFNGWKVNTDPDDETKLDAQYVMEAIAVSDSRVKSIKDQLDGVKLLYIVEHEFTNVYNDDGTWGGGYSKKYVIEEGGPLLEYDGNMTIKFLKVKYETLGDGSNWGAAWIPDAGGTNVRSLTPDTLYMPPHSETEVWPGSGAWNSDPVVLKAGTYYVVFAAFSDGTFGIGAIAK